MATNLDICTDAARELGAIPAGEALSAVDAADILRRMNGLGKGFDAQSIFPGWSDQQLSDEFLLDPKHEDGFVCMLAERIAPLFGATVSPETARRAFMGWQLIKADYTPVEGIRFDDSIGRMPSQRFYGWSR